MRKTKTERRKRIKAILSKLRNAADKVAILPLLPYMIVMRKMLKRRNINPGTSPIETLSLFYKNIVKPNTAAQSFSNFDDVDFFYEKADFVDPITIGAIASAVTKFIQEIVKNRREKKALSQVESELVSDYDADADEIEAEADAVVTEQADINWQKVKEEAEKIKKRIEDQAGKIEDRKTNEAVGDAVQKLLPVLGVILGLFILKSLLS